MSNEGGVALSHGEASRRETCDGRLVATRPKEGVVCDNTVTPLAFKVERGIGGMGGASVTVIGVCPLAKMKALVMKSDCTLVLVNVLAELFIIFLRNPSRTVVRMVPRTSNLL